MPGPYLVRRLDATQIGGTGSTHSQEQNFENLHQTQAYLLSQFQPVTPTPTPTSMATATALPTNTPTATPTAQPTNTPTSTPTAQPTNTPTPTATPIPANTNLAPSGTANRWAGLTSYNLSSGAIAAPGLNDGNLTTDVDLNNGADDGASKYEAAGVIWSSMQTLNTVKFINGSTADGHGMFATDLRLLALGSNGVSWTSVTTWTLSPAYPYTSSAAGQTYTFSGDPISAKGFRVVGKVNIAGNTSKHVRITEVQAFANSASPTSTPAPTSTPTATPAATNTPTPSPTATPTATPASGGNLAPGGTASRWYAMSSTISNSSKLTANALNDGNTSVDVNLASANEATANVYEGAGVVWTSNTTIGTFKFINGSYDGNGIFAANLQLQQTTDGSTWTAVTNWTLSPTYSYTNTAAGVTYTFTGTPISARGFRVVGQVNISGNTSKRARITEVQAFAN